MKSPNDTKPVTLIMSGQSSVGNTNVRHSARRGAGRTAPLTRSRRRASSNNTINSVSSPSSTHSPTPSSQSQSHSIPYCPISLCLPPSFTHSPRRHPIHRLPNELLSMVFIHGCPDSAAQAVITDPYQDPTPPPKLDSPHKHQVVVSSICRQWRAVAHTTPGLWTALEIREPRLPARSPPHSRTDAQTPDEEAAAEEQKRQIAERIQIIQAVIQRSGKLDLSVTIYWTPTILLTCRDTMGENLGRVRVLTVNLEGGPVVCDAVKIGHLPRLEHLLVQGKCEGRGGVSVQRLFSPPKDIPPQHVSFVAPIKTLRCTAIDLRVVLPLPPPPSSTQDLFDVPPFPNPAFASLSHLRHLQIAHHNTDDQFVQALNGCPNLESLTLHTRQWVVATPLRSPSLRYLSVHIAFLSMRTTCFLASAPLLEHVTTYFEDLEKTEFQARWVPLPSLKSYRGHKHCHRPKAVPDLLSKAPGLLAAEVWDADAVEVLKLLQGHTMIGTGVGAGSGKAAVASEWSAGSGHGSESSSPSLSSTSSSPNPSSSSYESIPPAISLPPAMSPSVSSIASASSASSSATFVPTAPRACPELQHLRIILDAGIPHELLHTLRTGAAALCAARPGLKIEWWAVGKDDDFEGLRGEVQFLGEGGGPEGRRTPRPVLSEFVKEMMRGNAEGGEETSGRRGPSVNVSAAV
ncbi:hypothetical protein DL93DRAFT_331514 [Clavulina sp. PMI_390]|nr:hypothetical protein DL93DRAFT_331514 [Clavulina sp. PMI_390]